jgi:hypothetical protein
MGRARVKGKHGPVHAFENFPDVRNSMISSVMGKQKDDDRRCPVCGQAHDGPRNRESAG